MNNQNHETNKLTKFIPEPLFREKCDYSNVEVILHIDSGLVTYREVELIFYDLPMKYLIKKDGVELSNFDANFDYVSVHDDLTKTSISFLSKRDVETSEVVHIPSDNISLIKKIAMNILNDEITDGTAVVQSMATEFKNCSKAYDTMAISLQEKNDQLYQLNADYESQNDLFNRMMASLQDELNTVKEQNEKLVERMDSLVVKLAKGEFTDKLLEFYPVDSDGKISVQTTVCGVGGCDIAEVVFKSKKEAYMYSVLRTLLGHEVYRSTCTECYQEVSQDCY